ncbi:hypothetical protein [Paenibacillus sp. D9]|uniref:hypothetical protein n=1 Tax=Paenibacillus sp. D9 TaxID=665792 RepID=UPI00067632EF|nr:hypothetical protein [Paenibacillus sp. D9]
MKKTEIEVGKVYHNGKEGRWYIEREVLAAGPEYKSYPSQMETDCLQYRVVNKGGTKGAWMAENCTRASLAGWAKGEVAGTE